MAKLSVREAAKRFDVSRPTLVKHLKSGKLSGEPVEGGGWLIDAAEMVRAGYPARAYVVNPTGNVPGNVAMIAPHEPVNVAALQAALAKAEARADMAEALAAERAAHIADLRLMLPKPRRWWSWG
jgi:excisionase family DNA binding protein